jgi:chromate transporter
LFVLPGFLSILALSLMYTSFHDVAFVEGLFYGLKAAVLAVVVEAVLRIGKRVLKNGAMRAIAADAFVAIFFFQVSFPVVVGAAALIGLVGGRLRPATSSSSDRRKAAERTRAPRSALDATAVRFSVGRTMGVAVIWLLALAVTLVPTTRYADRRFHRAAAVTFGGAYSASRRRARAVERRLAQPGEMLDGLGWRRHAGAVSRSCSSSATWARTERGALSPVAAGIFASVLTTWVTYAPSFLDVRGRALIEWLRGNAGSAAPRRSRRQSARCSTSPCGSRSTCCSRRGPSSMGPLRLLVPDLSTVDLAALAIAIAAGVALLRFHTRMIPTLLVAAALGAALRLLGA